MKNHTQNLVEKLLPDPYVRDHSQIDPSNSLRQIDASGRVGLAFGR